MWLFQISSLRKKAETAHADGYKEGYAQGRRDLAKKAADLVYDPMFMGVNGEVVVIAFQAMFNLLNQGMEPDMATILGLTKKVFQDTKEGTNVFTQGGRGTSQSAAGPLQPADTRR